MDKADLPVIARTKRRAPFRPPNLWYVDVAPRLRALLGGSHPASWFHPGSQAAGKEESSSDPSPGDLPKPAKRETDPLGPPLVLLVEDDPTNAIPAFDYLAAKGYQVVPARDGFEALAQAEALHPAIILMDITMPRMDGLEAMRRLRAHSDPTIASAPIIVVTARAMPGDREICMEAGADAYMAKPISLKALLDNIETLLQSRGRE